MERSGIGLPFRNSKIVWELDSRGRNDCVAEFADEDSATKVALELVEQGISNRVVINKVVRSLREGEKQ